jgi:hypothetical protein
MFYVAIVFILLIFKATLKFLIKLAFKWKIRVLLL